ncbi:hypothetical protein [Ruegeria sp.]|uniref:hypothetical protein n=1 Tax=Ruegeria sp. TaxID=1879320 RepID=UPI003B5B9430
MIRKTIFLLILSTSSVFAQDAETPEPTSEIDTEAAIAAAEAAGVTGFVPLVAPTLGVLGAAAGLAAAGGGGSTSSTTGTVNAN